MYRAGVAAIRRSSLARTVWRWSRTSASRRRRPILLSQKLWGWAWIRSWSSPDEIDENLFRPRATFTRFLVLEVNNFPEADPVSLVRFPKVLVTILRAGEDGGSVAVSAISQERLPQVLLARRSPKGDLRRRQERRWSNWWRPTQPKPK